LLAFAVQAEHGSTGEITEQPGAARPLAIPAAGHINTGAKPRAPGGPAITKKRAKDARARVALGVVARKS
jgi:hypothetical protein